MKLFALLCLVGFALSQAPHQHPWKLAPGSFTFDYESRILTGLPALASHYSGMGLRAEVVVNVKDSQRMVIQIQDAKYVRVSQKLHPQNEEEKAKRDLPASGLEADNWRFLQLPGHESVPAEQQRYLSIPLEVEFERNGAFRKMVVSREEPEWVVNFKKALVATLQTRWNGEGQSDEENQIQRLSEESNEAFWKVTEEGIDGRCDVTYQMNELPEYMSKDLPQVLGRPALCEQNSRYFELTKTKDVSSCQKRASFSFYKPGQFNCAGNAAGNCGGQWSRSSITRFIGCGTSANTMKIQAIYNEGELHQSLTGYKTENFLTGVRQIFKLKDASRQEQRQQQEQQQNEIEDPLEIHSLMYEMKFKNTLNGNRKEFGIQSLELTEAERDSLSQDEKERFYRSKLHQVYQSLPRNVLSGSFEREQDESENGGDSPSGQRIAGEMQKLFKQLIQEDIFNSERVAEKRVTMKVLNLARGFTLLDAQSIESLYNQLKSEFQSEDERAIFKNLFFDTLVMGGTVNNLKFLKAKILSGELNSVQQEFILMVISKYVLVPTEEALNLIFEIITSQQVSNNRAIYNQAVLGFSVLVQKACLAENRETSYPSFVFDSLCQPESDIVTGKWIPYLQRMIQGQNGNSRNLGLVAIGLLNHRQVPHILIPVVEQQVQTSQLSRYLAIFSLIQTGRRNVDQMTPLLFAIFSNPAESQQIREAAFKALIALNPSMTTFQRIAGMTWTEKDNQINELIATTLLSLSRQQEIVTIVGGEASPISAQRKAKLVYPLINNKLQSSYPASATFYSADFLPELNAGYQTITSWSSSQKSAIPQDFYYRLTYFLSAYQFNVFEAGVNFGGVENIVDEIMKAVSEQTDEDSKIDEQIDAQWQNIVDQLRIKAPQNNEETYGALFLNFFENSPMFYQFELSSKSALRQKVRELIKNPQGALLQHLKSGQREFNFQRAIDLAPAEFFIPSDSGFPIVIELHMPVLISFRGQLNFELSLEQPKASVNMKQLVAAQLTAYVGTVCPFTQEQVFTGTDQHYVHNVPASFQVEYNLREQEVKLTLKANPQQREKVDVFHYHVRPYTVATPFYSLAPMTLSPNVKWIESGSEMRTAEKKFGDFFGLNLVGTVQSESQYLDTTTIVEKLRMYNYNPLNMIRFGWASTAVSEQQSPSVRSHEYRVQYDPSGSRTQEIEVYLRFGVASVEREGGMKYHTLAKASPVSGSGRRFVINQGLPVEIESQPLGRDASKHQRRQQILSEALEKAAVKEGSGLHINYYAALKDSSRQVFSSWGYNMTVATGFHGSQSRWNVELSSAQNNGNKFCIRGSLDSPNFPIWNIRKIQNSNIEYKYENRIGFGQSCQESEVVINGNAKVSDEQKEVSRRSESAKKLQKMLEQNVPVSELSDVARQVRREATTLDRFSYQIKYNNVPAWVIGYKQGVISFIKAAWWPYLARSSGSPSLQEQRMADEAIASILGRVNQGSSSQEGQEGQRGNQVDDFEVTIKPEFRVMDVKIKTQHESIFFRNVRITDFVANFLPVNRYFDGKASIASSIAQGLTAGRSSALPQCQLEGNHLRAFNNRTLDVNMNDGCFHLLSADRSRQSRFAVLVRNFNQEQGRSGAAREAKIILNGNELQLTPNNNNGGRQADIRVIVNGRDTGLGKTEDLTVHDRKTGRVLANVHKSLDGVVSLRTDYANIHFDGEKMEIDSAARAASLQLCGICGQLAGERSTTVIAGPAQCVYSRPELLVASYKTQQPAGKCHPLNQQVKEQLQRENEQCVKEQMHASEVSRSFNVQIGGGARNGENMVHKHKVVEHRREICISRAALPECSSDAKTQGIKEKAVSFTCMPNNRAGKYYAEKARAGQHMPELTNLPETLTMTLPLPKTCVLAGF